jgi:hypothetical protein
MSASAEEWVEGGGGAVDAGLLMKGLRGCANGFGGPWLLIWSTENVLVRGSAGEVADDDDDGKKDGGTEAGADGGCCV